MTERERITMEEYLALPETMTRMEYIDGKVWTGYAPLPSRPLTPLEMARIIEKLQAGGQVFIAPADLQLGDDVVQPDVFWIRHNGDCIIIDNKFWSGAPDLVVEILSPSSASRDRGTKFHLYEKHGVREYWLVDAEAQFIEVFVLRKDVFHRLGLFERDHTFASPVLNGQTVTVNDLFPAN